MHTADGGTEASATGRPATPDVPAGAGNAAPVDGGFAVSVRWVQRVVVVEAFGVVDMLTAPRLAAAITAVTTETSSTMVIDLTGVGFLAAAGINVLCTARAELGPTAGFAVVAEGPATARPLRLLGLDAALGMVGTLDAALTTAR